MSTQPSSGTALDEWKETRSVLARFDNNLHDLRKYGFTFVTALLAANGLISQGGDVIVSPGVKAGILIATMGLIVTLKLLDSHYRRFQKAASIRSRILEDRLNIDLTSAIDFFYKLEKWWIYVQVLYAGFVGLTVLVGVAILWTAMNLIYIVLFAALVSVLLIFVIDMKRPGSPDEVYDWSLDQKIVSKGTPVRITFTNLHPEDHELAAMFTLSWDYKKEAEITIEATAQKTSSDNEVKVKLMYFENYDWLWETSTVEPGLYELEMYSARNQDSKSCLKATIQIIPAAKQEEPVKVVLEKIVNS